MLGLLKVCDAKDPEQYRQGSVGHPYSVLSIYFLTLTYMPDGFTSSRTLLLHQGGIRSSLHNSFSRLPPVVVQIKCWTLLQYLSRVPMSYGTAWIKSIVQQMVLVWQLSGGILANI